MLVKFYPLLLALLLPTLLRAAADDPAPSKISEIANSIDEQCRDWMTYSCAGSNLEGGQGFRQQVWLSGNDREHAKVEERGYYKRGEFSSEFYLAGDELVLVLDRSDTTMMMENAPTTFEERRLYFANGKLVHVLTKEASFPVGEKADLSGVENVSVPLASVDPLIDGYEARLGRATALTKKLRKIE